MMAADEDALACDIAETYGIYDMRALPAGRLAVLAVGLREDSCWRSDDGGDRRPADVDCVGQLCGWTERREQAGTACFEAPQEGCRKRASDGCI